MRAGTHPPYPILACPARETAGWQTFPSRETRAAVVRQHAGEPGAVGHRGASSGQGPVRRAIAPSRLVGQRQPKGATMKQSNGTPRVTSEPRRTPPTPAGRSRRNGVEPTSKNGQHELDTDRIDERKLLEVLTALRKGNFAPCLPVKWTGIAGKVADTVNEVMETNQRMAREVERLTRVVGKE